MGQPLVDGDHIPVCPTEGAHLSLPVGVMELDTTAEVMVCPAYPTRVVRVRLELHLRPGIHLEFEMPLLVRTDPNPWPAFLAGEPLLTDSSLKLSIMYEHLVIDGGPFRETCLEISQDGFRKLETLATTVSTLLASDEMRNSRISASD